MLEDQIKLEVAKAISPLNKKITELEKEVKRLKIEFAKQAVLLGKIEDEKSK